jgi:hypothetical protein
VEPGTGFFELGAALGFDVPSEGVSELRWVDAEAGEEAGGVFIG